VSKKKEDKAAGALSRLVLRKKQRVGKGVEKGKKKELSLKRWEEKRTLENFQKRWREIKRARGGGMYW